MTDDKKKEVQKEKPTAGLIARILKENNHFATIKSNKNEDILIYNEKGIYEYGGEVAIKEQVQNLCGDNANTHFVNEVIGQIRRMTYIDLNCIDEAENILNCQNGLVNMSECKLMPHTPAYHSFIQIPVEFNPDAKCLKSEAFINSIFNKEDAETIKEFLGFLFIKRYIIHKALMITGASHSGKTTLVNMIQSLIGHTNVASITLQDLCDKPFSVAELHGKMANISDDLPSNPVKFSGQFKRLTGESMITAERKFRDPFVFQNNAKAIFTCNELPPVQAGDDAYFYRWLIVETNSKFNRDKVNRNMLKEITSSEELSGLLNLALKYRAKIIQQNDFSHGHDISQSKEKYMLSIKDSVAKFINEEIIKDNENWIAKDSLYELYKDWCVDYDYPAKAQNAFHRRFHKLLKRNIIEYYPVVLGKQIRAYKGIRLANESND